MIRSRDKRNQRLRRATRQRAPRDHADEPLRMLVRGRVELGKSGGGLCYGYKVTRSTQNGEVTTGDREIVPPEAEVIGRIFRDYVAGVSPKALARQLNAEHCPGPGGKPWNPSTIHGIPLAAPES